jgi:hypothetical protein
MVLSPSNLAYYLLERGLVSFDSVVDGDFLVVDVSCRNRNFKVIRKAGPSYFVKQVKTWEPQSLASLHREATCYWLSEQDSDFAPLRPLLPRYHGYDPGSHVLVVELMPGVESVAERHRRLGAFPTDVAAQLGHALGTYHRDVATRLRHDARDGVFKKSVPWILSFHQHGPEVKGALSSANSHLLGVLQRYAEFPLALDAIRGEWRVDSLIHGDMKWENCLVCDGGGAPGAVQIKVVDWELADLGDACWDVGAIFQAYLSAWVLSMPISGQDPVEQAMSQARYPLESMQPAIRAFWEAYAGTRRLDGLAAGVLLERCIRFGGARMIQTAYEYMNYSQEITPAALCLLQVSLNVLSNPREAIRDLLGL